MQVARRALSLGHDVGTLLRHGQVAHYTAGLGTLGAQVIEQGVEPLPSLGGCGTDVDAHTITAGLRNEGHANAPSNPACGTRDECVSCRQCCCHRPYLPAVRAITWGHNFYDAR